MNKLERKEYNKKYHKANKDKLIKQMKEYNLANKDKIKEYNKKYHKANKDKITKQMKDYRKANKDKIKEYYQNNKGYYSIKARNREKNIKNRTFGNIKTINEFYKNCPKGYHVDHIIPLKGVNEKGEHIVSGLHTINNLQYLPAKENHEKYNKFYGEYYTI